MYRPKDSDIFGTSSCFNHPKIENTSFVDPNAAFRKRTDEMFERYTCQLGSTQQTITKKAVDASQVNQKVEFDQHYHRNRKERDLQSSIFYPPREQPKVKPQSSINNENNPYIGNRPSQEVNFGRKETIKREINELAMNSTQFRGNASRLFDMNDRIGENKNNEPLMPLVPHGMKWDQHDSVKYAHINYQERENRAELLPPNTTELRNQQQDQSEKPINSLQLQKVDNQSVAVNQSSMKPSNNPCNSVDAVEVRVLKGWNPKVMEGLAKHCKLNKSAIVSFTSEGQKATIYLKRSERWENITDWLRKDCKLKLRVIN